MPDGIQDPPMNSDAPVVRHKLYVAAKLVLELAICAIAYCVASLVLLFPERGRTPEQPTPMPLPCRPQPRINRAIPAALRA